MKILIAGGGTGGHVYPAVAIGKELRHRHPDWAIEFAGRHDSIEGRIIPAEGFEMHELFVSGYERYYSKLKKLKVINRTFIALKDSYKLLKKIRPDCVVGTGGYICGPVVLMASFMKIPTLISEQNVIPGFTIKTLSRFADTICIPFEQAREYMHKKDRCVLTGNPVRREFGLFDRSIARKTLKIEDSQTLIVSFGGSLGAKSINGAVYGLIKKYEGVNSVKIIHITGSGEYEDFMNRLVGDGINIKKSPNIQMFAYTNEMPLLLNAADIVISRSGAMSVSEINYVGIAAIYVPHPYSVFDHQTKNAMFCVDNGAALMIKDENLNANTLTEGVESILNDPSKMKGMAKSSAKIGLRDSSERIAAEVEKLVKTD